jgi:hypothetical protein
MFLQRKSQSNASSRFFPAKQGGKVFGVGDLKTDGFALKRNGMFLDVSNR